MPGKPGHRGFGYVRKLPSGRYQASYIGPDTIRHTAAVTFQAKKDAEAWLAAEHVVVESGDWQPPRERTERRRRDSFGAYAEAWLEHRTLKPRTRAHYRSLLDRLILPSLGTVAVRHMTPESVRAWYGSLSPDTATQRAHAYALVRAILKTAVDDRIIPSNPCTIRGAGNAKRASRTEPATVEELATIVESVPERYRLMILLASWCAMRYGELAELRRSDIDVRNNIVRVRRGLTWVDGQAVIGQPKSNAGIRDVAIPPHVMPAVKAHLRRMPLTGRDALVFPAARDPHTHMRPATLSKIYYPARAKAGRDDLRFHDLRHSGATLATLSGASLAEVMRRLGHSTPGAAMKYQHALRGRDAEIAAQLSKIAGGS